MNVMKCNRCGKYVDNNDIPEGAADLIRSEYYEIYGADWLRTAIRMLMGEAYEWGRLGIYPFDMEIQKGEGDGWKELHEEINNRVDTMLDIGVRHVKGK